MYLVAVMDWHSGYVLAWRLSNTLEGYFCIDALDESLSSSKPEIFNTDQGSQFTARGFTGLEDEGIAISMDGRGRAGQRVHGTTLENGQVRGCLSQRLRSAAELQGRPGTVLRFLSPPTTPFVARLPNTCRSLLELRPKETSPIETELKTGGCQRSSCGRIVREAQNLELGFLPSSLAGGAVSIPDSRISKKLRET